MRYEMTSEAKTILDFLQTLPTDFTYQQLQAMTGVNDLTRLRGYLMTALRRMRKKGVWYVAVRGVGYRLLSQEDEKNPEQDKGLKKIRRKAKRVSSDQDTIDFSKLSNDGKLQFTFNAARVTVIMDATGRRETEKIKRKIADASNMPINDKDEEGKK